MSKDFLQALLIGVAVMTAVFLIFTQIFNLNSTSARRAGGIFAGAVGLVAMFWLLETPDALVRYTGEIAIAGILVVLSLLYLLRRIL